MSVEVCECGIDIIGFMGSVQLTFVAGHEPVEIFHIGATLAGQIAVAMETGDFIRVPSPLLEVSGKELRTAKRIFTIPDELRGKIVAAFRGESTFSTVRGAVHV